MTQQRETDDELEALAPAEEAALLRALAAAARPEPLSPERNRALVEAALAEPDAVPTAAELEEAEALRRALESGAGHPGAELARALASSTRTAAELEAKRATQRALARALPRPRVLALVSAAAALSLAAALALLLSAAPDVEQDRPSELTASRSLSPLFAHEAGSGPSERLDRIVAARSRDLRDNRFTTWGVR